MLTRDQPKPQHQARSPGGRLATHDPPPVVPVPPMYMPINEDHPGLTKVHEHPPIYVVTDFLTHAECDQLIATAGPLLQR